MSLQKCKSQLEYQIISLNNNKVYDTCQYCGKNVKISLVGKSNMEYTIHAP